MTTCNAVFRVAGEYGPDLYSELESVDLTGKSISLSVRYEAGGEISKPAVIDDAAGGLFHFVWDVTDLVEGNHSMEFVVVDSESVTRLPSEQPIPLIVRAQA